MNKEYTILEKYHPTVVTGDDTGVVVVVTADSTEVVVVIGDGIGVVVDW